jgi:hypothetical protein
MIYFKFLKQLLSSVKFLFERKNFNFSDEPFMPTAEKKVLMEYYEKSKGILEFGSGSSTIFALKMDKYIVSVENDRSFYSALKVYLSNFKLDIDTTLIYANTGLTGKYGSPFLYTLTPAISEKGFKYVLSGYLNIEKGRVDLIFVDGRWRVGCCLYSIFYFDNNIDLFLDDYETERNYAFIINKYFIVTNFGRLAKLEKRNKIDKIELIKDFYNSMKNSD